jgi:hypothetical protein
VIGVGVADTQPAAEVVDVELAQFGDGCHRCRQLIDVEDLRADVRVHPDQAWLAAPGVDDPLKAVDVPDELVIKTCSAWFAGYHCARLT